MDGAITVPTQTIAKKGAIQIAEPVQDDARAHRKKKRSLKLDAVRRQRLLNSNAHHHRKSKRI
jgi:hypothetical protein